MADELDVIDEIDETEVLDGDEPEGEQETIVTFGEEEAPSSPETETALLKHLRATAREQARELAQLRKAIPKPELGDKPDLWEDCEGDVDRYDQAKAAWDARKVEFDKQAATESEVQSAATERNRAKFEAYEAGVARLGASDYADAQSVVEMALPHNAQSAIIEAADNPAAFVYAISKYPEKLQELAKIDDPIQLIKAVWKLEGTMTVTTRRKGIAPEQVERGDASPTTGSDKIEKRLQDEANKTGNYTALFEHRRQKAL